ncbi:MAG: hypothetical protein AAF329_11930 [Cyanobacteria bacterium P01_A01_bin.17]
MELLIVLVVIGSLVFALKGDKKEKPKDSNTGKKLEDGVRAIRDIWREP